MTEEERTPLQRMLEARSIDIVMIDMLRAGGISQWLKIAGMAEAFNLPVTSHGAHDVSVHLLAACPNRSFLEIHGFGLDRYIAEPMRITEGNAIAPDQPGHGVLELMSPHERRAVVVRLEDRGMLGEALGVGQADPLARPGDDGDLALELVAPLPTAIGLRATIQRRSGRHGGFP